MSHPISQSILRGGRSWIQHHYFNKIGYPAGNVLEEERDVECLYLRC
jgi:hypothetical protein